jgi:hypothetical protein
MPLLPLAKNAHYVKETDRAGGRQLDQRAHRAHQISRSGSTTSARRRAACSCRFSKKDAIYSSNSDSRRTTTNLSNGNTAIQPLVHHPRHLVRPLSIPSGGALKDWYSNQLDPRVPLPSTTTTTARDTTSRAGGVVKFFSNGKAPARERANRHPRKYSEMVLIQAECTGERANSRRRSTR